MQDFITLGDAAPSIKGMSLVLLSSGMSVIGKLMDSDLAIGLSIVVSLLAAVDYALKIHWKIEQRNIARRERKRAQGEIAPKVKQEDKQ